MINVNARTSHRPCNVASLLLPPATGDNRPPSLGHTMRPCMWWPSPSLSGVLLRCRRPAAAACLYSRSSSHIKWDSSSWAVRRAVPHTGQQPAAAADISCWPPAEDCCCCCLIDDPLLLLLLWLLLLLTVAVVAVAVVEPLPLAAGVVVGAVVIGGDSFFPAEHPKMSLKSKYGVLAAVAGTTRSCCGCGCGCCGCCCRALVKSVIARRTLTATNWLWTRADDNTR